MADVNLNCRYGPDTAYLYAWGLEEGKTATLDGRNFASTWLLIYWSAIVLAINAALSGFSDSNLIDMM